MSVRQLVSRIDAATPAHRDRAVDGLRALALLAVPAGHWLLGGFTRDGDGALHNASPLSAFGGFAPVSWVLQMLGVFFLVGGYASVLSYHRRPSTGGAWLRARMVRLGRPVLGVTAVWALMIPVLYAAGVPEDTLRTGAKLVIQPLWFVGVYTLVTALTPCCARLARRFGGWAAAPLIGSVAAVDFLRYGPYADAVPSWVGVLNILPGWLFAYQLGVCWGQGRLSRHCARLLLVGGTALFALLLLGLHYPASMVGVPGEARTNSHPPSLLVLALASAQSGAAVLLHGRIGRALRRPALWAPVVVINLSAMTILCWHQTAMLAAAVPASFAGLVPGLTTSPDSLGWIVARTAWLPVFAALLVLISRYARRFEEPWETGDRAGNVRRAAAGLLAAGFAVFALRLA
ncbi:MULTISPECIES: acyltransferase family protein [Streptomyces]|uniref:Acyltransferase n=1 Tax=Streptomyces glycanivorans TaxID=3033808 RepID=A0ABY9JGB0_9ACTN|nr:MULTISPECIES: acyltransferase [unclassified Streptomyces]TXS12585.1 acyltransferase [Streptomyces sp. wa22]WLQ66772.1 acyltransferase [Streptomyces sp. Alt3]WSQ80189.1 acyltransferase [Streptomyces sp. NBC_01213]WSR06468.1 acyltransferase [Streptomyces sp. NBC_01208]